MYILKFVATTVGFHSVYFISKEITIKFAMNIKMIDFGIIINIYK